MYTAPSNIPEKEMPAEKVKEAAEAMDIPVDIQALAREILALMKEDIRLEKERLGIKRYS